MAALSATDVWAVGTIGTPGGNAATLIEHWDGQSWSAVQGAPTGPVSALNGVASVSTTDVWAVGIDSDQQFNISPLAERWDGASWQHIRSAPVGRSAAFYGVTAVSPSSAWAVGAQPATPNNSLTGTLIEEWDGAAWSVARSPDPGSAENVLVGASELSSGFSWAVGDYKNGDGVAHTLVEAIC